MGFRTLPVASLPVPWLTAVAGGVWCVRAAGSGSPGHTSGRLGGRQSQDERWVGPGWAGPILCLHVTL